MFTPHIAPGQCSKYVEKLLEQVQHQERQHGAEINGEQDRTEVSSVNISECLGRSCHCFFALNVDDMDPYFLKLIKKQKLSA